MAEPIDPTKRIADRGLGSGGMSWRTAQDGFEEAARKIRRVAQGSDGVELVDVEHSLRTCATTWLNEYVASWSNAKVRWEKILAGGGGEVPGARERRQEFFDGLKKLRVTFRRRLADRPDAPRCFREWFTST
jgi:hypothetical protein